MNSNIPFSWSIVVLRDELCVGTVSPQQHSEAVFGKSGHVATSQRLIGRFTHSVELLKADLLHFEIHFELISIGKIVLCVCSGSVSESVSVCSKTALLSDHRSSATTLVKKCIETTFFSGCLLVFPTLASSCVRAEVKDNLITTVYHEQFKAISADVISHIPMSRQRLAL